MHPTYVSDALRRILQKKRYYARDKRYKKKDSVGACLMGKIPHTIPFLLRFAGVVRCGGGVNGAAAETKEGKKTSSAQ
jgi:hypothetical protein